MNKIEVTRNNIISNEVSDIASVSVNNNILTINFRGIIEKPVTLINNIYKDVVIFIENNTMINLIEIRDTEDIDNFKYKYILGDNSKAIVNKFNYGDKYCEDVVVNLDGYESDILFNLSVISLEHHIYNININHNNKKTISNINNHGITLDSGKIDFIINGTIKKGMSDSKLFQDNKIMTLGNGKGTINPNLFIDDNMVEARHGASIGRFNEDEIFYLESRGISLDIGYQMLSKGFLLGTLKIDDDTRERLDDIISMLGR